MVDLLTLLLSITVQGILVGAESCYDSSKYYYYSSYFYCSSCCGYWANQYCCTEDTHSTSSNAGTIAGVMVGGVLALGLMIALIVHCLKKDTTTVHVIHT